MKKLSVMLLVMLIAVPNMAQPLVKKSTAPDTDVNALKREAVIEVEKMQKLTQEMVDSIFSFAELGFQEYETSKYITGILEKSNAALLGCRLPGRRAMVPVSP
jgi:aminobenzoyl-glutamate utilization protein B